MFFTARFIDGNVIYREQEATKMPDAKFYMMNNFFISIISIIYEVI